MPDTECLKFDCPLRDQCYELCEMDRPPCAKQASVMGAILKEADILRKEHPSKDCRFFAESVFRELQVWHNKSHLRGRVDLNKGRKLYDCKK